MRKSKQIWSNDLFIYISDVFIENTQITDISAASTATKAMQPYAAASRAA